MGFAADLPVVASDDLKRIKTDRCYLELALEEAGRLLGRPTKVSGSTCCCPFHPDEHPSGSLHQDNHRNGRGAWLFTCHGCGTGRHEWNRANPKKLTNSGDAIAVLRAASKRAGGEMSFQQACRWLLDEFQQRYGHQPVALPAATPPSAPSGPDPARLAHAREEMRAAQARLTSRPELLDGLWRMRAVDKPTAVLFGVGYSDDEPGGNYWVFPIADDMGELMVVKFHAAGDAEPKSWWYPSNAKTGDPLFPIHLTPAGLVWLCPGELKALAAVSLGLSAVGITSGEQESGLSDTAVAALRSMLNGRPVAIPADNDEKGRVWAEAVQRQLTAVGIDARMVDLGLTTEGDDIGDFLVRRRVVEQRDAATVRGELQAAFAAASAGDRSPATIPAQPSSVIAAGSVDFGHVDATIRSVGEIWQESETWKPVERISTHIAGLDHALFGGFTTRGVHIITGKPGAAKTQLVVQIAVNVAQHGVPVGLISLEMDRAEIARLALAQLSEVPRTTVDNGLKKLHERHAALRVRKAIQVFHDMPLAIVDGGDVVSGFTREHLARTVAMGVAQHGWRRRRLVAGDP